MDEDLQFLNKNNLIKEIIKLRMAIRAHRDSTGHDLCWHHPKLWSLLPEKANPEIAVPEWSQFMNGCIQYRKSLDEQSPHSLRTNEEPKK